MCCQFLTKHRITKKAGNSLENRKIKAYNQAVILIEMVWNYGKNKAEDF